MLLQEASRGQNQTILAAMKERGRDGGGRREKKETDRKTETGSEDGQADRQRVRHANSKQGGTTLFRTPEYLEFYLCYDARALEIWNWSSNLSLG